VRAGVARESYRQWFPKGGCCRASAAGRCGGSIWRCRQQDVLSFPSSSASSSFSAQPSIHTSPVRPPFRVPGIFRRRLTILQMRVWALYACWYARWCWWTLFGALMRLCGGKGWWLAFCSLLLEIVRRRAREINQSPTTAAIAGSIDCRLGGVAIADSRESLLTPSWLSGVGMSSGVWLLVVGRPRWR
jgi:hypothetical protein